MSKRIYLFMFLIGLFLCAILTVGSITRTGKPLQKVDIKSPLTAFGELSVAEPTPRVQLQFPYNLNTDIIEVRDNFGTSTVVNNMANMSTGAVANRSANILSLEQVKYNPGQDGRYIGTAVFTTGVANSVQWVGIGDSGDGYFFGYNGSAFSILRRQGGVPETRRLAITTGSSDADSVTITLNGNTKAVTVTDSSGEGAFGSRTVTANEIADGDYSNVGRGWEAHAMGPNVFFRSYSDDARFGTYTLTDATSAVGTVTQSLAGVTSTETITAQTAWNRDRFLFSTDPANSLSRVTLDPTKGNVFQIKYQWLGFGKIDYFIEKPETGELVLVHRIEYANANTVPSVNNPTLPLYAIAENTSNDSDIVLKVGSMAGLIGGKDEIDGIEHSYGTDTANIGLTETPIFTIHSHDIYQSVVNRVGIDMIFGNVSVDGTKPAIVRVRKNATIVGSSFSPHDSGTSIIHQDFQATSVTGGEIIFQEGVAKNGTAIIPFHILNTRLIQPDFLTLSIEATSGSIDAVSTFNWEEKF